MSSYQQFLKEKRYSGGTYSQATKAIQHGPQNTEVGLSTINVKQERQQ